VPAFRLSARHAPKRETRLACELCPTSGRERRHSASELPQQIVSCRPPRKDATVIVLKTLKSLLMTVSSADSIQSAAAPEESNKAVGPDKDYRAVLIAPGATCCLAANLSSGERYLLRDAPRLPLAACTKPADCSCRYTKVHDRRTAERRQTGIWETTRWFAGTEKRTGRNRRSGNH
jgi:hypothetical protein